MGPKQLTSRLRQLWQFPLLLFALGSFFFAAYLFIDPKPGPTVAQRVEAARVLLDNDRPDAAIELLNKLLLEEDLKPQAEGAIRVLLGQALQYAQKQRRLNLPVNHLQIIEQTRAGIRKGIVPDAAIHHRLAESYEALGRYADAAHHYRQAAALDRTNCLAWLRKVVELQLAQPDPDAALACLQEYLDRPGLADGDRTWAIGEKARLMAERNQFQEAAALLADALGNPSLQPTDLGVLRHWSGYCQWKLGNVGEAERLLRSARDLLGVAHALDAHTALLLGQLKQQQNDLAAAASFYAAVLQSHLDSPEAYFARLYRSICRIASGEAEAGLSDLHDLKRLAQERRLLPGRFRDELIGCLRQAMHLLVSQGNYEAALEVLGHEQDLVASPTAEFFERLARVLESRAGQLENLASQAVAGEQLRRWQQAREYRSKAGDAYLAEARLLVIPDDQAHGQALWKAIEQYELGADLPRVTTALETFVAERPADPRTPEALLRLGQSYQVAGLLDKAIEAYRKNQYRYPKSLAASKSLVPLARAYIAKGPEFLDKAEQVLRAVVENNPQISPQAEEFREALWELASLYCRTRRFEQAIARLEEIAQRYPKDPRMGQLLFLMAGAYRASAESLDERIAQARSLSTTRPDIDLAEATSQRQARLLRACQLYAQVIDYCRAHGADSELDRLYLKLSYFHQADCLFDLGRYAEAITRYGDAAFRYQDDVLALGAYVQIVNANVALGRLDEAKAANERAKTMLRRMPPSAFSESSLGLSRGSWEQWLNWASQSGLWK